MKKILFAFMLLLSLSTLAQDSVIGDWKIVVLYNEFIYYNVKLDSIYAKASWNDSIVEMTNDNIGGDFLKANFAGLKEMEIHFFENGKYKELHSINDEDIEGTFVIDNAERLIMVKGKDRSGGDINLQYHYSFREGNLILRIEMPEPDSIFTLEMESF